MEDPFEEYVKALGFQDRAEFFREIEPDPAEWTAMGFPFGSAVSHYPQRQAVRQQPIAQALGLA
jgi:hypothetical protein